MADIVLKDANGLDCVHQGITSLYFKTANGGMVEFSEGKTDYVIGEYIEIELLVENWNGTSYTLNFTEYGEFKDVQIGVPPSSSIKNAHNIIQSGIAIVDFYNSYTGVLTNSVYTSTTITLGCVTAPLENVRIALWRS